MLKKIERKKLKPNEVWLEPYICEAPQIPMVPAAEKREPLPYED